MPKSTTQKVVHEASKLSEQAADWIRDRLAEAPEASEIKEAVSDRTRQTLEAARDRMEDMAGWLGEMAENFAANAPHVLEEPPASRKASKAAVAGAVAATAAGGWYFFNPETGKDRRTRLRNYLSGIRDRIMGRVKDADVFVDRDGDFVSVDDGKVAGISGVELNG